MGPSAFIIMHQMELLRTIILIGDTYNEYIEKVLSSSVNVFSLLFVPEKYIPNMTGRIALPWQKNSEEFIWSGYKEATSFYLLLIVLIQGLIGAGILALIS